LRGEPDSVGYFALKTNKAISSEYINISE
jgi:hypothetical protein